MAHYVPKVIRKRTPFGRVLTFRKRTINGVKCVLHATKGWRVA